MKCKFLSTLPTRLAGVCLLAGLLASLLAGCLPGVALSTPTLQPLPDEIVFYNWVKDMPDKVLQAFTQEYGVQVRYETYESQEDAEESMEQGAIYDVVVMDNRHIPGLIKAGRLAALNPANLSNLTNIAVDFRDRPFDPGNRYSVPYNWGTTGLVVRSDQVLSPVTSWNDLWKQDQVGKVVMWSGLPREMIGATLKALGYSANSENRQELEQALEKLNQLRPNLIFVEDFGPELETSSPILTLGNAVMAVGWSFDAMEGQKDVTAISYVLPKEGALLWGDNFVIPANSPNQYAAELFINFILRPEISALITDSNGYATGNEKANKYISPELFKNTYIFPPIEEVRRAEIILPLSPEGEALHEEIWQRFTDQEN